MSSRDFGVAAMAARALAGGALLIVSALAQDTPPDLPADHGLKGRINEAIDRGVEYLASEQHRDGSWTGSVFGSYRAGPTALAAYVLVESGVSASSPSLQLALDYLLRNPPTMTYSAGCLMLLLAEIQRDIGLTKELEALAENTLEKLASWESKSVRGAWGYPGGQVDLSNTQFAALGFWAGSRMGLEVPLDVTQRMVMTTIERHQEEPTRSAVELASRKGRSRAGRSKIAGYMYPPNPKQPARASMTIAGLCVQRIAREIFGRKLGRKVLKASDASEALAMGWMEAHWSVTENYGTDPNKKQLYYLWGIERLGAFLEADELFGHRWYEEGATHVLELEKNRSGNWGRYHETGYALLFLRRATRAASSGTRSRGAKSHWLQDKDPVAFRVTGTSVMTAFLVGLERKDAVAKVEWLLDGELLEAVNSKVSAREWKGERFAIRWTPETAGKHNLVARVHYAEDSSPVDSAALKFESRLTFEDWAASAAEKRLTRGGEARLLASVEITAEASSAAAGQDPERAVDGLEGTAWIADDADERPRLELTFDSHVKAEFLTVSHAASKVSSLGDFDGVTKIAVTINGKGEPAVYDLPPESAATIELKLPKKVRVRSIVVEVLRTQGGPGVKRGFAEVGLR